MTQVWHWLALGFLLMTVEIFAPSFASLLLGLAALAVGALVYLGFVESVPWQITLWLLLSLLLVGIWLRFINPHVRLRTRAGLGAGQIVGEVGMIVSAPVSGRLGRVRFAVPKAGAGEWACRAQDDALLPLGTRVVVVDILGNELVVAPKSS